MDFLDILKDSAIDTLKLVPLLVAVYFLIEILEYKNIFKFEQSKLLSGKASPVVGAICGAVPQCGFSVISSELYSKKKISVSALIAVFVATSDEAIPILFSHISNKKGLISLIMLIVTKIIMAILIGYFAMLLHKILFKKAENIQTTNQSQPTSHDEHSEHNEDLEHIHACCHHDLEDHKFDWKHPLIHSAKITLYIFIINLLMGTIVGLVTEERLTAFLQTSSALQPLVALLVGLIPNCASSVILTELYLMGGLSFGAIITGLSVNAGLGFLVLFKENKNIKENLFILSTTIVCSLAFGYLLTYIPLPFLA